MKFSIKILILFIFVVAASSCSSPEKDKAEYYQSALEHIANNEREAAILQLKSVLQIDAKHGPAYYQLGLLYLEEQQPKEAFDALLRAADLEPENVDASLKVAQFYLLNRKKAESRERLNNVLNQEPENREALTLLANLELVEGNYDEALAVLGKIGPEVENSDQLQNVKGRIFAAQEDWLEAEKAFLKAVSLKSDLSNYRVLLLLYQKNQEKDKAKVLLDKMVTEFPENPLVLQLLANYYRSTGEDEELVGVLNKIIELEPTNPRFNLQLAEFYRDKNKDEDAESVLKTAIGSVEEKDDLEAALATLYFDQKQFEKARELVGAVDARKPGHGGIKLLKARFFLKEGKNQEGIALLEELTKDFPEWGEPYFFLGLARYSRGEVDLAQAAVDTAIKKYARNAKYHTLMAQIYQTQGAFEDAQKEALVALRLNPQNIRSALILSRALIDLKRYDQAISLLKSMNGQVPGNAEILGNLALAHIGGGQVDEGEKALVNLLDAHPGNTKAVLLLLDIKYKDDPGGGEAFIREQLEKDSKNTKLHLILGETLVRQKKYEDALTVYNKVAESVPEEPASYLSAAKILRQLDRLDEAEQEYVRLLERRPNSLPAHMGMADLLQLNGDGVKAKEHYREVLKIKEGFVPAANNLAWLIASDPEGDLGEALMLAMQAKQGSPDSPVIADTLGWVHLKRESYSLAQTQFEIALEGMPNNPTMTYHLALALYGNGKADEAKTLLSGVLQKNVSFEEKDEAVKLLEELKGQQ